MELGSKSDADFIIITKCTVTMALQGNESSVKCVHMFITCLIIVVLQPN